MQLVATKDGQFFRGQSVIEKDIEFTKQAMLHDGEDLTFEVMTDEEFEQWLMTQ